MKRSVSVLALMLSVLAVDGRADTKLRVAVLSQAEEAQHQKSFSLFSESSPFVEPHAQSGKYYLEQLEMAKAWQLTRGSPTVKVAVLSTGVNYRLQALASSIEPNSGEMGGGFESDGIDNDNNGYIDDVFGVNTLSKNGDPMDNNNVGTFGTSLIHTIAPNVRIIPVAVCDEVGICTLESIKKGIEYAQARGASLIHMAMGGKLSDETACEAILHAQIPVVGASGNEAIDFSSSDRKERRFPVDCGAPNLILAASTDESSRLAYFSSYGFDKVHVAAPGVKVEGLDRFGNSLKLSGGSSAGAAVTGVLALLMSYHPDYSLPQLKEALLRGTDLNDSLQGKVMSGGRINAYKVLTSDVH